MHSKINYLINHGVKVTNPSTVEISPEVRIEELCRKGVEIHGPVRIKGELTSIGPHAKIGTEGPVTICNCQLGEGVELAAGSFTSSVFLTRVRLGPGAFIREACLLEEEASIAHCVGLKHTVLFPFVTLGSLINFCDCLMAGGTSRKNHSEVGSSFIHFNFTPNQDKATCSLLGDVPRGVMLREPPIFLGGQGGIVGPIRLGFGTVTKAGTIVRHDDPDGGNLLGEAPKGGTKYPFLPGLYVDLGRRIRNNVLYVANILALSSWYRHVRVVFFSDGWGKNLFDGAMRVLNRILEERCFRLRELAGKMDDCINIAEKKWAHPRKNTVINQAKEFKQKWPLMEGLITSGLEEECGARERKEFLDRLSREEKKDYITTVKLFGEETCQLGTRWLKQIVDGVTEKAMSFVPTCKL
ncbi:MAG: UDP-N-acetylglucosamine pyrophosphorylase [Syntrophales bacterium]|nr:UDP-N-acetylglucosamine pyrophosphorylase [Syntrophales bacterium]